jgi:hypothetical protein
MLIYTVVDRHSSSVLVSDIYKPHITLFVSSEFPMKIAENLYVNLNLCCDEFITFQVFCSFLINVIEHSFLTHSATQSFLNVNDSTMLSSNYDETQSTTKRIIHFLSFSCHEDRK